MYESLQYAFAAVIVTSLVTLIVLARQSVQREALVARFWCDLRAFSANIIRMGLAVFFIIYIQGVIGRTTAFYLHHRMVDYVLNTTALSEADAAELLAPRLFDIGHYLTPDLSTSTAMQVMNELLQYIMFLGLAGVFAVPYWLQLLRGKAVSVFTVNMVARFVVSLACGHALRMCAYMVTSLPGSAAHCVNSTDRKPTKVSDIFLSPRVGGNCGDLIFSGHMLTATTIVCTMQLYVEKMFSLRQSLWFVLCFSPIVLCQVVSILMLRAHYSVDIVVAVEVGVSLNLVLSRLIWTCDADVAPPLAERSARVETTHRRDDSANLSASGGSSSERLYKEDSMVLTAAVNIRTGEDTDLSDAETTTTTVVCMGPDRDTSTASSSADL